MLIAPLTALALAAAAPDANGQTAANWPQIAMADMPVIEALPLEGAPDQAVSTPPVAETPAQAPAPADMSLAPAAEAPLDDAPPASLMLRDPWENPNRAIWNFDIFFERNLLGPVAHGYQAIAPQPVRDHLSNAILNLDEPLYLLNNLLQLKIGRAIKTGARFVINSTIGVAGLFDVAGSSGLPARKADFGQTLARWGAKPGPYVMIPFLGPSNVRDGFGRLVDTLSDPVGFVIGGIFTSPGGAARFTAAGVNWRQQNDGTMKAIYGAQDPYAFTRSAYAQQRAAAVQDATGKAAELPDF
jgi:phospholipid-binding lipoprotein MlaA